MKLADLEKCIASGEPVALPKKFSTWPMKGTVLAIRQPMSVYRNGHGWNGGGYVTESVGVLVTADECPREASPGTADGTWLIEARNIESTWAEFERETSAKEEASNQEALQSRRREDAAMRLGGTAARNGIWLTLERAEEIARLIGGSK